MSKTIRTIPATIVPQTGKASNPGRLRRVAGYARVSTDHDEQFTSYETQINYYRSFILSHPDWKLVDIYSDEGISGTMTARRDGFNRMVADALEGKIDLIITKSVSRFARNTVDSLTTIRSLKEKGVEVYFEKENIWTFDGKGELLLTIMSSIAQEESRSISENVRWGIRKGYAQGKYTMPYAIFLGYEKGPDGNMVVNPEEAELIKRIFSMYLSGMSGFGIADQLTKEGIPSPKGKRKWKSDTVLSILRNEKYKGDALLQKRYTVNYIGGVLAKNNGEIPQYYIEQDHEAIIDPITFDEVQAEIHRRGKAPRTKNNSNCFLARVRCGQCGAIFGPKVWHSNDKYRKIVWNCNDKYGKSHPKCTSGNITEERMREIAVKAIKWVYNERNRLLGTYDHVRAKTLSTDGLEKTLEESVGKMRELATRIDRSIAHNASTAVDQDEFNRQYERLTSQYNAEKDKVEDLKNEIRDTRLRRAKADAFMKLLAEMEEPAEELSQSLWARLCDGLVIHSPKDIRVVFKNGDEYREETK